MFATNPFALLSATVSPTVMQTFVVVMALLVFLGTLFDIIHKRSAAYFFRNWRESKDKAKKPVGGGKMIGLTVQTAVVDVLASGEFCNMKRRIAHLLGMYGFVIYLVATIAMVFCYPTTVTPPAHWPMLWWIGALMVCLGGYWFWFFIRVDVAAEGNSPFRIVKADIFILALVLSTTFGLLWAWTQIAGSGWSYLFLALYLISTIVLFGSIPWSKFSHMFFKPAAALEKRVSKANGTAQNLPTLTRDDPEQQKRHSMELLQNAPMRMGPGIKREAPRHY